MVNDERCENITCFAVTQMTCLVLNEFFCFLFEHAPLEDIMLPVVDPRGLFHVNLCNNKIALPCTVPAPPLCSFLQAIKQALVLQEKANKNTVWNSVLSNKWGCKFWKRKQGIFMC